MALPDSTVKLQEFAVPVPDYDLHESNSQIVLSIHAPLCNPNNISVILEKKLVKFEADPYSLILNLPCSIKTENCEESFDKENGTYVLTLRKEVNIDEGCSGEDEKKYLTNGNVSLCNIESQTDSVKQLYGFANIFSRKFGPFYKEFSQVIELEDPDNTKEEERTRLRHKEEEKQWNEDHYLADFVENEHIQPLLKYTQQWCLSEIRDLNQYELEILENIPKMKCLETDLTDNQRNLSEFQMVDILLSYCYNKRTTEGDNTVVSPWTINKLSSCLSWLEVFKDLKSVLVSFYRRSLTYPLYRNWELTRVVHKDVVSLLKLGSSQVTRCFIEIKELFEETERFHILNTLFIDPFCHFSYSLKEEKLLQLADNIEKIEIEKEQVHEDLIILELAARVTLEEEQLLTRESGNQMNEITEKTSTMNLDESGRTSLASSENVVPASDCNTAFTSGR